MIPTPRTDGFDAGKHRGKPDSTHAFVKMFPTPTVSGNNNGRNSSPKAGTGLATFARMFSTPAASWYDGRGTVKPETWEKRQQAREEAGKQRFADPLHVQVMFGTPRSTEWKGSGPVGSKSHAHMLEKGYLCAQVQTFPTPRSSDGNGSACKHGTGGMDLRMAVAGPTGTDDAPSTPSGSLNPQFVEWLMGFPMGWTVIEDASQQESKAA